jgi:hypothetical protein
MKEISKTYPTTGDSVKKLPDLEFIKNLEIDKIKPNTLLVLRINTFGESVIQTIQTLSDTYGDILKAKGCSFLIMSKETDISTVSEKEMNKLEYFKREEKKLITLN